MGDGWTIPDQDEAAFPTQSHVYNSDLEVLRRGFGGDRVAAGLEVTAQGSPDMSVHVADGMVLVAGAAIIAVAADDLSIDAADATFVRIDLISVSSVGVLTVTAGIAADLPALKPPDLPSGHIALGFITVPPTATEITDDLIIDKRFLFNVGLTRVVIASHNGCALDSDLDSGGGTDDTVALQALLDRASTGDPLVVILDGAALVSGLDIYSNTTLRCLEGAGLFLKPASNRAILRNAHRSRTTITDEHIAIRGGRFNGNRANQTGGGSTGHQESDDTFMSGIELFGVDYLTLRDLEVADTMAFGVNIGNASHLTIRDYHFDWGGVGTPHTSTNQDGLHLNGPISHGYIANLSGQSNDDLLAICAGDDSTLDMTSGGGLNVQGPYVGQGAITDVLVEGLTMDACLSGIRILSHDSNSRIDRVTIRDVTGTCVDQALLVSPFGVGSGSIGQVTIDGFDVRMDASTGSASPSLMQFDGTCELLALRNIRVHKPADNRPWLWVRSTATYDAITIDGLASYDTVNNGAGILPIKLDGYVKRLRIGSVNWVRFAPAAQATALISLGNAASHCDALVLDGVQANAVNYLVNHTAGTLTYIQAAVIRHETTGSNASFRTTGTVSGIELSNWWGTSATSGTFTATHGDAFGSTFAAQAANKTLAGPTSGADAVPTFRALVADDIPALDAAKVATGVLDQDRLGTGATGAGSKILYDDGTWGDPPSGASVAAVDVSIADAGGYFASGNVEGALQEAGASGATGDMGYASVQLDTLVNEVAGWPPYVPDGSDLVTLGLWFRDVGTPTTKATVVAVSGESGVTATFGRAIKCVGDGSGDGFKNLAWTYANEPRVKSGRKLSVLCYIWCVGGVGVTAKLVNSDASETAATMVTAAAWTLVEIPNHTLAGTTCELQFILNGAGTFYVAALSANIGSRAFGLGPRTLRRITKGASLLADVDSAATWTDVDLTSNTSPLAAMAEVQGVFSAASTGNALMVRRNGSTSEAIRDEICRNVSTTLFSSGSKMVDLDDGNIFEYKGNTTAATAEHIYMELSAYWEWA